jgi:hypothetical protein
VYIEYVVAVVSNNVVLIERKRGFALAFAKLMPPS